MPAARQWNPVKRRMHFRVTSYNILAQCYANNNPQLYSKLRNPETLKWTNRWPLLKGELQVREVLEDSVLTTHLVPGLGHILSSRGPSRAFRQ